MYFVTDPDVIIESVSEEQGLTWKVGDPCRALYSLDGLEYEGTIEDIAMSEDDNVYMTVHLLGYEERETVWRTDLIKSQGQAARVAQLAAVSAAENALESANDGHVQDESQTRSVKTIATAFVEQPKFYTTGVPQVKTITNFFAVMTYSGDLKSDMSGF